MLPREHILMQALNLPPADQAFLAQALEDHLTSHIAHETPEHGGIGGGALLAELQQRSESYQAGTNTARNAENVLADLKRRQADEV